MCEESNKQVYEDNGVEINFSKSNGSNVNLKIGRGRRSRLINKLSALLPILCLIAFLLLGFLRDLWHPGWAIFLLIPVGEIALDMFSKKGKSLIIGLTIIICFVTFMVLGLFWNLWHPGWLIFLAIPVVSIIVD